MSSTPKPLRRATANATRVTTAAVAPPPSFSAAPEWLDNRMETAQRGGQTRAAEVEEDSGDEEMMRVSAAENGDAAGPPRTLHSITEPYGCHAQAGSVDWIGLQVHLRHNTHQSDITTLDLTHYRMAKGRDLWVWFATTIFPQLRMLEVLRLVQMGLGDNEVVELLRGGLLPLCNEASGTETGWTPSGTAPSSPSHRSKRNSISCRLISCRTAPDTRVCLPHLRVLDLSGNHISQRSCTPLGKAILWMASSLEEVRLLGNPLKDYGCQTLAVYLSRLNIEGLVRDPAMFSQRLHQEHQHLRRQFQASAKADRYAEVVPSSNDAVASSSKILPRDTATAAASDLNAALAALPMGLTLLDLRDCRASARGLSDVLAGASRAQRLHTVILSHNTAGVSALLPAPQSAYRDAMTITAEGDALQPWQRTTLPPPPQRRRLRLEKTAVVRSGVLLQRGFATTFSDFAPLALPSPFRTITFHAVPLSQTCSPIGCREMLLNLFFCCPSLTLLDLSETFEWTLVPSTAVSALVDGGVEKDALQQSVRGPQVREGLQLFLEDRGEVEFVLDSATLCGQTRVADIVGELFAHAAFNAVVRQRVTPAAFSHLRELHLNQSGFTDDGVRGLCACLRGSSQTGMLAHLAVLNVSDNLLSARGCVKLISAFLLVNVDGVGAVTMECLSALALQRNRGCADGEDVLYLQRVCTAAEEAVTRRAAGAVAGMALRQRDSSVASSARSFNPSDAGLTRDINRLRAPPPLTIYFSTPPRGAVGQTSVYYAGCDERGSIFCTLPSSNLYTPSVPHPPSPPLQRVPSEPSLDLASAPVSISQGPTLQGGGAAAATTTQRQLLWEERPTSHVGILVPPPPFPEGSSDSVPHTACSSLPIAAEGQKIPAMHPLTDPTTIAATTTATDGATAVSASPFYADPSRRHRDGSLAAEGRRSVPGPVYTSSSARPSPSPQPRGPWRGRSPSQSTLDDAAEEGDQATEESNGLVRTNGTQRLWSSAPPTPTTALPDAAAHWTEAVNSARQRYHDGGRGSGDGSPASAAVVEGGSGKRRTTAEEVPLNEAEVQDGSWLQKATSPEGQSGVSPPNAVRAMAPVVKPSKGRRPRSFVLSYDHPSDHLLCRVQWCLLRPSPDTMGEEARAALEADLLEALQTALRSNDTAAAEAERVEDSSRGMARLDWVKYVWRQNAGDNDALRWTRLQVYTNESRANMAAALQAVLNIPYAEQRQRFHRLVAWLGSNTSGEEGAAASDLDWDPVLSVEKLMQISPHAGRLVEERYGGSAAEAVYQHRLALDAAADLPTMEEMYSALWAELDSGESPLRRQSGPAGGPSADCKVVARQSPLVGVRAGPAAATAISIRSAAPATLDLYTSEHQLTGGNRGTDPSLELMEEPIGPHSEEVEDSLSDKPDQTVVSIEKAVTSPRFRSGSSTACEVVESSAGKQQHQQRQQSNQNTSRSASAVEAVVGPMGLASATTSEVMVGEELSEDDLLTDQLVGPQTPPDKLLNNSAHRRGPARSENEVAPDPPNKTVHRAESDTPQSQLSTPAEDRRLREVAVAKEAVDVESDSTPPIRVQRRPEHLTGSVRCFTLPYSHVEGTALCRAWYMLHASTITDEAMVELREEAWSCVRNDFLELLQPPDNDLTHAVLSVQVQYGPGSTATMLQLRVETNERRTVIAARLQDSVPVAHRRGGRLHARGHAVHFPEAVDDATFPRLSRLLSQHLAELDLVYQVDQYLEGRPVLHSHVAEAYTTTAALVHYYHGSAMSLAHELGVRSVGSLWEKPWSLAGAVSSHRAALSPSPLTSFAPASESHGSEPASLSPVRRNASPSAASSTLHALPSPRLQSTSQGRPPTHPRSRRHRMATSPHSSSSITIDEVSEEPTSEAGPPLVMRGTPSSVSTSHVPTPQNREEAQIDVEAVSPLTPASSLARKPPPVVPKDEPAPKEQHFTTTTAAAAVAAGPAPVTPTSIVLEQSEYQEQQDRLPSPQVAATSVTELHRHSNSLTDSAVQSSRSEYDRILEGKYKRLMRVAYDGVARGSVPLDPQHQQRVSIGRGKWGRQRVDLSLEWEILFVLTFEKSRTLGRSSRRAQMLVHPVGCGFECLSGSDGIADAGGGGSRKSKASSSTAASHLILHILRPFTTEAVGSSGAQIVDTLTKGALLTTSSKQSPSVPSLPESRSAAGEGMITTNAAALSSLSSAGLQAAGQDFVHHLLQRSIVLDIEMKSPRHVLDALRLLRDGVRRATQAVKKSMMNAQVPMPSPRSHS